MSNTTNLDTRDVMEHAWSLNRELDSIKEIIEGVFFPEQTTPEKLKEPLQYMLSRTQERVYCSLRDNWGITDTPDSIEQKANNATILAKILDDIKKDKGYLSNV